MRHTVANGSGTYAGTRRAIVRRPTAAAFERVSHRIDKGGRACREVRVA